MTDKGDETKNSEKKLLKKIRSKHDEVVKNFFSEKETAKSFFQEYLPAEIVKNLDFKTLKIVKDSFVDKKLAQFFSDILYQINLDDIEIFIYLLIDHKSREEKFTGFQFLKYMVRIWELHLKQNKKAKTLPVIIPIVIYHGTKKWEVNTHFNSFFNTPEYIKEYIPDFKYNLHDFSHVPDERIKGVVLLRILLMVLKYAYSPQLQHKLHEEIFPLFLELKDKKKGTEYLEVLLRYLTKSAKNLQLDKLNDTLIQVFDEGGDIMATIAEDWKKEGMKLGEKLGEKKGEKIGEKKGEKIGEKKGKWDVVKNSLQEGLPINIIERITGFSSEEIIRFKENNTHIG